MSRTLTVAGLLVGALLVIWLLWYQSSGATLRAAVRVDDDVDIAGLELVVIPSDGTDMIITSSGRTMMRPIAGTERSGVFHWTGLRPETYKLIARAKDSALPLRSVVEIVLGNGENRDPRLEPLDLRGALQMAHLRVEAPGGDPLPHEGGTIWLGEDTEGIELPATGIASFVVASLPIDVLLSIPGYRRDWHTIGVDAVVELRRAIAVEFSTEAAGGLPKGKQLVVSVTPIGAPRDLPPGGIRPIAPGVIKTGVTGLAVEAPGRYQVIAVVADEGSMFGSPIHGFKPLKIEVLDTTETQKFALEIPQSALDAALR